MKRIVLVIPNLTFGGIQSQVVRLAEALGHDQHVIILGLGRVDASFIEFLKSKELNYVHFSHQNLSGPISGVIRRWKLLRLLRELKPDILMSYTFGVSAQVNSVRRFTRVSKSYTMIRGGKSTFKKVLTHPKYRHALKFCDGFIFNSEHAKEDFELKGGFKGKEMLVIKNGIAVKSLEPMNKLPLFVHVANFYPEKDIKSILLAWELFIKGSNEYALQIIGAETKHQTFQELEKMKEELNLSGSLKIKGAVSDIDHIYEKAQYGILSSKSEGCPNVILEYLNNGLVPIATRIAGNIEILNDVIPPKLFFSVGDVEELYNAMKFASNMSEIERTEIISKGREQLSTNYSMEDYISSYKSLVD